MPTYYNYVIAFVQYIAKIHQQSLNTSILSKMHASLTHGSTEGKFSVPYDHPGSGL